MKPHCLGIFLGVALFVASAVTFGDDLPDWTGSIRSDHPRLFFNADTWPAVKERALGPERAWYDKIEKRTDRWLTRLLGDETPAAQDRGREAASAAFLFLVTEDERYLELARRCLQLSLDYYEQCLQQRKAVDWYSTSRVHAVMAWDWLYEHLSEAQRRDTMSRLIRVIDGVVKARPRIPRENLSGYQTGFYGVENCFWFIGCSAFGTGIETEQVNEWLVWGYDENHRLLEHRKRACGDDGGGASPTIGYVLGAYPWSEQNFLYTVRSATGKNLAGLWPHGASLAGYVIWNWIGADPEPLQFGYGDTPHTDNRLNTGHLYTHMANIRNLYGRVSPRAAFLASWIQAQLRDKRYSSGWFIYPFLLTSDADRPTDGSLDSLPRGRHFESMGQIFMRSGTGPDDTYCLFTSGGILRQHRHYDALNFVIYHRGFLALDSGTRFDQNANGEHLANYYAQTVAHNCVVIHQPGEPPADYWGGTVTGNHGGQHHQLGSVVKAFGTNDDYVYVAGDATACYQHGVVRRSGRPDLPEKCTQVTRQLVFLLPDHFVIFDRVISTDPAYRKDWLIHTAHQPRLKGQTFRADHDRGRVFCRTLLPAQATLTAVGGPGKAFLAAGRNWAIEPGKLQPRQLAMMGQWRVEVTPSAPSTDDLFLHVIRVSNQDVEEMGTTELLREKTRTGVRLTTESGTWEVVFDSAGALGGHIRRTGVGSAIDAELSSNVQLQRD